MIRQFRWLKRVPSFAVIGALIVVVNLSAAIFAPIIAPFEESETVGDVWEAPSRDHLLGTDNLGRDMLSRMLFGARASILISLAITALSFSLGVVLGFTAAIRGGWVDSVIGRAVDALMAIPTLIFALVVLTVMGSSIVSLVGTIAILDSTRVYRLSRAVAGELVAMEFVEVARLRGEGTWWILSREILPNALSPLVSEFGLRFCYAFLFVAALSFLGLGIQPPAADWGSMVRENAQAISFGEIAPLVPAIAVAMVTIGVNLTVDWLLSTTHKHHRES